ncbi:thiamine pyrophosphate-binding protein [Nonomuraea sp. 3-1Str]|uniref:thiamine pyrophosphate-binding protein n=1 Tax=Nonomuraea sp. 3-1Str TaxID=2929801 RepID=UPI0028677AAD|nr:thiamine pyrophosphate-binding protein [Nonomuraea sp. 3-1Str]MDR8411841.1 thiamine pyrophosphate-binding protein [Nonomuraea sp. 3-1Str]
MIVAEAVGRTLASLGAEAVFGVVGSGNFHVTNALVEHGARFVAARHEGGAATAADAYARTSGKVGILSVHQGPGLTNAMTGVAEAAKSRTPLVVLAGEATDARSNFHIDQDALVRAVGAVPMRVSSGTDAVEQTVNAFRTAREDRRTVLLNLPLGAQTDVVPWRGPLGEFLDQIVSAGRAAASVPLLPHAVPGAGDVEELAGLLAAARRPVFVAGRGARHARRELEELAGLTGALLATSAVARGLFRGNPWELDVSGGFATPLAAELIRDADLVVGWGCALNMWTTRHGTLIGPDTVLVQVDLDDAAIGLHRPVRLGLTGDTAATARAVIAAATVSGKVAFSGEGTLSGEGDDERYGYRSPELARRIAAQGRWRDVPYTDEGGGGRIDPRTLTIALDDLLPAERTVAVDSGNFMGYPSMFLDVPDERAFCFTQAFQSVGLGLATAIGAAVARPDRLTVAALGDGGALMSAAELETVVRLGLPMVVVVYDDEAYGAEVHHFGPHGYPLDLVTFPPADLAAIGRGYGFEAVTVTGRADLSGVARWLEGARERPLLVHARVTRDRASWWLEEAFKGH